MTNSVQLAARRAPLTPFRILPEMVEFAGARGGHVVAARNRHSGRWSLIAAGKVTPLGAADCSALDSLVGGSL